MFYKTFMCGVGLDEKGRIPACTGTGEIFRLQNLLVKSTQFSCFVVILERLSWRIKTHVQNVEQGHSCIYMLLGYDVVPIYYSNTMFLQWAIGCCSSLCNCGLCISNIHDLTTFNMWSFSNLSASLSDIDLTIGWMVCANFNLWLFGEGDNFQACWKVWSNALLIPCCMPYWLSTSTQAFEQVVIEVSKTLGWLGICSLPMPNCIQQCWFD
jgi:hypothetical protein